MPNQPRLPYPNLRMMPLYPIPVEPLLPYVYSLSFPRPPLLLLRLEIWMTFTLAQGKRSILLACSLMVEITIQHNPQMMMTMVNVNRSHFAISLARPTRTLTET